MSDFRTIVNCEPGTKLVLQGNIAFALGTVHAGFHAADGYPGTPSTEVIDKALSKVQDRIKVGWSVNEAVATAVGVGYSLAGMDVLVTMKTPGAFQAADVISTAAFYDSKAGALVLYIPTDYVPTSTQHVIDLKYFLSSCRIPVLEPRNVQEMYDIPSYASYLSKKHHTPVVVLASGTLAHSEALITTGEHVNVEPIEAPPNLLNWMRMPNLARKSYNRATMERIPAIRDWAGESNLVSSERGTDDFGIIVNGASEIVVRQTLQRLNLDPSILSLAITYPIALEKIEEFASLVKGKLFIFEEGDTFIEEKILASGIKVIGKRNDSIITNWSPEMILDVLCKELEINLQKQVSAPKLNIVPRPPSICPGCPYKAFSIAVDKLKKQKKLYGVFGDIGCSTLLYFLNSLDTVLCMGASDAMRQGFVLARPEYASKTISVIGDSTECHSGLDATRNAVFRNAAGVKVILDNSITAMTGGQPAPSTSHNLAKETHGFNLKEAVIAEGGRTVEVDSYNLIEVENELREALNQADNGIFSTLILKGPCIHSVKKEKKERAIIIDREACVKCNRCDICPGIENDSEKAPHFTNQCTNCAGESQVCMQRCPQNAIVFNNSSAKEGLSLSVDLPEYKNNIKDINESKLPESIQLAIRGVGGQGNLFFGKVLAELMLHTSYQNKNIVKGETHGMAQLGGSVISTFSCGNVYSSELLSSSADVLIAMEYGEVFRPGFLELLKPEGIILVNQHAILPQGVNRKDYPEFEQVQDALKGYHVVSINAMNHCKEIGDSLGKLTNMVVLGRLSALSPFSVFNEELWIQSILEISGKATVNKQNVKAFLKGRYFDK